MEEIPYQLIGELMKKMSAKEWIAMYEQKYRSKSKNTKAERKVKRG
jgi:hypothetical protein